MKSVDQRSVLIVEDDEAMRECLTEQIKRFGYSVMEATNGAHGLELIAKHEFHTVLSDISMPVMDGLEFLAHAIARGSDAPFVILTGYGSKEKTLAALRLGAWDFIEKPFSSGELETVLARSTETAFRRRRLAENLALPANVRESRAILEIERDRKFVALCQVSNAKKGKISA